MDTPSARTERVRCNSVTCRWPRLSFAQACFPCRHCSKAWLYGNAKHPVEGYSQDEIHAAAHAQAGMREGDVVALWPAALVAQGVAHLGQADEGGAERERGEGGDHDEAGGRNDGGAVDNPRVLGEVAQEEGGAAQDP